MVERTAPPPLAGFLGVWTKKGSRPCGPSDDILPDCELYVIVSPALFSNQNVMLVPARISCMDRRSALTVSPPPDLGPGVIDVIGDSVGAGAGQWTFTLNLDQVRVQGVRALIDATDPGAATDALHRIAAPAPVSVALSKSTNGSLDIRVRAKQSPAGPHEGALEAACSGTYVKTAADCDADRNEYNREFLSAECRTAASGP